MHDGPSSRRVRDERFIDLPPRQRLVIPGKHGAIEGTRTPTPLPVHGPEPCASANSATMASGQSTAAAGVPPPRKTYALILQTLRSLSNQLLTNETACVHSRSQFCRGQHPRFPRDQASPPPPPYPRRDS